MRHERRIGHRWAHAGAMIGALATSLWFNEPTQAQEFKVPGTSVTMTPPAGFTPATDFAGFANLEKQGSFVIAEMPAEAMQQLSGLFGDQQKAAAGFATKGIKVETQVEIETKSGETVPLLHGSQEANGVTLDKWMALYAGEKTVMITFQIPQETAIDAEAVKAAFTSVTTGAAAPVNAQTSSLPFEIEAARPFRVIQALAGASVLMMAGDKDVDPEGKQPMAIAAYSKTSSTGADLAATAEATLRATKGLATANVTSKEETTFAGSDGIVLQGTFDDKGIKKKFSQSFTIDDQGRVMHFLATASEGQYDEVKDAIDEIAGSIDFKD